MAETFANAEELLTEYESRYDQANVHSDNIPAQEALRKDVVTLLDAAINIPTLIAKIKETIASDGSERSLWTRTAIDSLMNGMPIVESPTPEPPLILVNEPTRSPAIAEIEMIFRHYDATRRIVVKVPNAHRLRGMQLLHGALVNVLGTECVLGGVEDTPSLEMFDNSGPTQIADEDNIGIGWLMAMLVSYRVIGMYPETTISRAENNRALVALTGYVGIIIDPDAEDFDPRYPYLTPEQRKMSDEDKAKVGQQ